jgi:hypothetical protein
MEAKRDIPSSTTQPFQHPGNSALALTTPAANPQKALLEPNVFGHSKSKLFLDTIPAFWITFKYFSEKFVPRWAFGLRRE